MLRLQHNMSESISIGGIDESNAHLYEILKDCANFQSYDALPIDDPFNDAISSAGSINYYRMLSTNLYSASGNISSCSSFSSDDSSFGDNILEEDGRISLAYENLRCIPRRIAEKFASYTKCLDLSYNNFSNLSFLTFFEELHTLILDHNTNLDLNTLPYLPNLKILWINNCDISNITDWIHQVRKKCPVLEQISLMGNPGLTNVFYCPVTKNGLIETNVPTDYRQYVLHSMPNLKYLDGIPKEAHTLNAANEKGLGNNNNSCCLRPSGASSGSIRGKSSSILNIKELFSLRRRKKSYQSSSTS